MSDYSLVPVEHQPDFGEVSFIPVDHDPFDADDMIQQAWTQPEGLPRPSANGAIVPPIDAQAAEPGESYNPDSAGEGVLDQVNVHRSTAAPLSPPDKAHFDWSAYYGPTGELKAATYTPTQRIGNLAADALIGIGMKPYTANDLASRVGKVLGLTPLGVVGSALDLIDAKRRDDLPGAVAAAAGMIPGAKGLKGGNIAKEITLLRSIHGEAAAHAADAISAGKPGILTIYRPDRNANSWLAIGKLDKVAGKDLDEYPPAMFKEGGFGASVRPIDPKHNRSAGARIGNLCRGLPDGAQIKINIGD